MNSAVRAFRSSESGNIFFTLFGAIAVVGLLGGAIVATIRGPLATMVEVQSRAKAESEMAIASRLVLNEAAQLTNDGDCDGDGFVEPLEYTDAGGSGPVGGGYLPEAVAAARIDPWGTEYGYCAWDAGSSKSSLSCDSDSSGTNLRLEGNGGATDETYTVVAIVSAGPDQIFDTTCVGGDNPSISKSGDDIVTEFTYSQARATADGLWNLKAGDPETAEISKDIEVTGGAKFSAGIDLTGSSAALELGAASMLFPTEGKLSTCNAANDGLVRINTSASPDVLELCDDPNGWVNVSASVWRAGTGQDIYYNVATGSPQVGIGTASPTEALHVVGNILGSANASFGGTLGVTGTSNLGVLNASGAVDFDSSLNVDGNTILGGTLSVTGATTLSTLHGTGAADFDSTLNADGNTSLGGSLNVSGSSTLTTLNASGAVDLDSTLNVDGSSVFVGDIDIRGDISDSTGNVSVSDDLDVSGDIEGTNITASGNLSAGNTVIVGGDILGPAQTCSSTQKLQWDTGTGWSCVTDMQGGASGGVPALDDLTDVTLSSPNDGECLIYDGSDNRWENIDCNLNGIFENAAGVVRMRGTAGSYSTDDFLFGSPSLSDAGITDHDNRMMFRKVKGAFRAGGVGGTHWNDANVGSFSAAFGEDNIASGYASFVAGRGNNATQSYTTALGNNVSVGASYSVGLGYNNGVTGAYSNAIGSTLTTSGRYSSNLGFGNTVAANYATAIGTEANVASSGVGSMAIGLTATSATPNPQVSGSQSLGIFMGPQSGYDMTANNRMALIGGDFEIDNDGLTGSSGCIRYNGTTGTLQMSNDCSTYFDIIGFNSSVFEVTGGSGTERVRTVNANAPWVTSDFIFGSPQLSDTTDPDNDNRMFYDKSKAAFRVGAADADQWDDTNVGVSSVGIGSNVTASGIGSLAFGSRTSSSGLLSSAFGYQTDVQGDYSVAFGNKIEINGAGDASAAFGLSTTSPANIPTVSGRESFMVFMGDHSSVNASANQTFGIFGGKMVIDPAAPATQLSARSVLDLGAATDSIVMPAGTTAQRPSSGVNGMFRYDTTVGKFQGFQQGAWQDILTSASGNTTALSSLTAATATNGIDSANYAQVWNWNTLTTQTALNLASSSLTSGTILNISTTSNNTTASAGALATLNMNSYTGNTRPLVINNYGIGQSLLINDDGSTSDSTPVAIDASGNLMVGVGTTTSKVHIVGDSGNGAAAPPVFTVTGGTGGNNFAGGVINMTAGSGSGSGAGGAVNITAGASSGGSTGGTGTGGALNLNAGYGGMTSGVGGALVVSAGDSPQATDVGGSATVSGGDGITGGALTLRSGDAWYGTGSSSIYLGGSGSVTSGSVTITSGATSGSAPTHSGAVNILTANSHSGFTTTAGNINLTAGNGGAGGTGGAVNITAGNGGATNVAGSNVVINPGDGGGTGADGNIVLSNTRGTVLVGTTTAVTGAALVVGTNNSMIVPVGEQPERPTRGVAGMFRYNRTTTPNDTLEYFDAETNAWISLVNTGTGGSVGSIDDLSDGISDETSTVFLGTGSGAANTGVNNTAVGINTLSTNVAKTGSTAIGFEAMRYADSTASTIVAANTAVGYRAMRGTTTASNNTGTRNTAVGYGALMNNDDVSDLTAVGYNALTNYNGAWGGFTAVGSGALANAVGGINSTAVGQGAAYTQATADEVTAIGYGALYNNVNHYNTCVGARCMYNTTNGSANAAVGSISLFSNTSGSNNIAFGHGALQNQTTNSFNIGIGTGAGSTAQGSANIAIGYAAGNGSAGTMGTGSIAIGHEAMRYSVGSYSVALGYNAMGGNGSDADNNIAIGAGTMSHITSGDHNVAIGGWTASAEGVLNDNTTGSYNVGIGSDALQSNVAGNQTTAVGYGAMMFANSTATSTTTYNTAMGYLALRGSGSPSNNTGTYNTAIGHSAMIATTSGNNNVAVGTNALSTITSSTNNVAVGANAGRYMDNTCCGGSLVAIGSGAFGGSTATYAYQTVAIGHGAASAGAGDHNTLIGHAAGINGPGHANTCVGAQCMLNSTGSAQRNTAFGLASLYSNTSGSYNTAIGGGYGFASEGVMRDNTTGSLNTALGYNALKNNKTGSGSVALGFQAMYNANNTTTGFTSYNTAVGYEALRGSTTPANNTGTNNTAIGHSALLSNTSGSFNTVTGVNALISNSTGSYNTVSGVSALNMNETGSYNTAMGYATLTQNTSGTHNTAIGSSALTENTTGSNNVAVGIGALESNLTGSINTVSGVYAMTNNNSGSYNSAYGQEALFNNTTGDYNTAFGNSAGYTNATGSNNTFIGNNSDAQADNFSNSTALGFNAVISASNQMVFGDNNITNAIFNGNGAVTLPNGTDAQRPTGAGGMIRYNTTATPNDLIEYYDAESAAWVQLSAGGGGGSSVFEVSGAGGSEVVRSVDSVAPHTSADFLFGSAQLADAGNASEDSRMFFDKSKGAFRAGSASGTQWDNANVGIFSTALGHDTRASGAVSFAIGNYSVASADASTSIGEATSASGYAALALGSYTSASGGYSTVIGHEASVTGNGSMAIGLTNDPVATDPIVSGSESLGIFLNGQSGINVTGNNVMAIMGGNVIINPNAPSDTTVTPVAALHVEDYNRVLLGYSNGGNEYGIATTAYETATGHSWGITTGTTSNPSADVTALGVFVNNAAGRGALYRSSSLTTGSLIDLEHSTSAFAGNMIQANMAFGSGSFSGNFIRFQNNSDQKFYVADDGEVGAYRYCDEDGNNCFLPSAVAGSSVFELTGAAGTEIVRSADATAPHATADFLFGSAQLADAGNASEDSRMFFDKSKGAFRAGTATGTEWDDANVGDYSIALGLNNTAAGDTSIALGREINIAATGDGSMGVGLTTTSPATDPIVSGAQSYGIFMGNQSGVNFTSANTMGLFGGRMLINPNAPSDTTVSTTASLHVVGDILYTSTGSSAQTKITDLSGASPMIAMNGADTTVATYVNSLGPFRIYAGGASPTAGSAQPILSGLTSGYVGIGQVTPLATLHVGGTGAMIPPSGTDAQRPASPVGGMIRYNTTATPNDLIEYYDAESAAWVQFSASGGGGAAALNDLSDAITDYATDFNMWIGSGAGASIASGGQYNLTVGQDAGNAISTGDANTAFGYNSLKNTTTGSSNTAMGLFSLYSNTIGQSNVAIGQATLYENIAGSGAIAIGDEAMRYSNSSGSAFENYNIAIGRQALYGTGAANGGSNTAIGREALYSNSTGGRNTALGAPFDSTTSVLGDNTTGELNTAVGAGALSSNVAGNESTAVGAKAMLYANSTSTSTTTYNTAVGYEALRGSTTASANTGTLNTAIGHSALKANTSGNNNTAVGYAALDGNTTGIYNVAVGTRAIGSSNNAGWNTAVGHGAGESMTGSNNTVMGSYAYTRGGSSGSYNTVIGSYAIDTLGGGATGSNNTVMGYQAMIDTKAGGQNISIGNRSLATNVAGNQSTAIGYEAMRYANSTTTTTTTYNTAVGYQALIGSSTASANTGTSNTALGHSALSSVTSGSGNTALGTAAGNTGTANTTGSNNTYIGYNTQANANNYSNSTALGYGATITASNQIVFGNTSITNAVFNGNGAVTLPNGTDAQRPTGAGGMIRYNTTATPNDLIEYYDAESAAWVQLSAGGGGGSSVFEVTGGAGSELVRSANASAPHATADFLFGSAQLADAGNASEDSRMFFDKSKGAFRAGVVTSTQWDDANAGLNSIAFGEETTASGDRSFAHGLQTTASGNTSVAFGNQTIASGTESFAMGSLAEANAELSTAIGRNVTTAGTDSLVFGRDLGLSAAADSSAAFGLTITTPATAPIVTGSESFVVFMGNQSAMDFTENKTFGILGGKMLINPDAPTDPTVASTAALHVVGDIEYTGTITDISDRRLKTDIKPLGARETLLDKLSRVKTYSFAMKNDTDKVREYGVMAQELETIFPELVKTAPDSMGTKSVNYIGLIPPMIESVKALREENSKLQNQITHLTQENLTIKSDINALNRQIDRLNNAVLGNVQKASSLPMVTIFAYILAALGLGFGLGAGLRRKA